ncbi:MAG TPA: Uma2 family endonuclease [Frankiaceae bacterium]|nr:Uma2 family endonuclease [Frankiaceae bacterium]
MVSLSTPAFVPPTRPWTLDDLAHLPDDGHRYEIIDGSLLVAPPPSPQHQLGAARLSTVLRAAAPGDVDVVEATGVQVGGCVLVPDLLAVRTPALLRACRVLDRADVLLTVEVVSPSSVTTDRVTKPALLADAGVPAYWRVELSGPGSPLVVVHRLDGGTYRREQVVRAGETARVDWPFTVRLSPADLTGLRR